MELVQNLKTKIKEDAKKEQVVYDKSTAELHSREFPAGLESASALGFSRPMLGKTVRTSEVRVLVREDHGAHHRGHR